MGPPPRLCLLDTGAAVLLEVAEAEVDEAEVVAGAAVGVVVAPVAVVVRSGAVSTGNMFSPGLNSSVAF